MSTPKGTSGNTDATAAAAAKAAADAKVKAKAVADIAAAGLSTDQTLNSPYYTPSTYNVYQLTQTSQPDIASIVNSTMLNLVGRAATPQEIQQYGAELLSAERANQGLTSQQTTYQTTGAGVGKKGATTGTDLSTGVNAADFIGNLIRGTADARTYQAATQYFDAMKQSNNKYTGGFSG
jgi:hypothetical protein